MLPATVTLRTIQSKAEEIDVVTEIGAQSVDIIVCSLALHHIPGYSRDHCHAHGLTYVQRSKSEVLAALGACLKPTSNDSSNNTGLQAFGILNEADMYSDITLPPNDETLRYHIATSYWHRAGLSILHDVQKSISSDGAAGEDLQERWAAMLRLWFVDEIDMASLSLAERDVYELGNVDTSY